MSYILDALRKADAERERDPARGIHAQSHTPAPAARRGLPPLAWPLLAAGVAAVAVAGYAWRQGSPAAGAPTAIPAPAPVTPPPALAARAAADFVQPAPPPVVVAPQPVRVAAVVPAKAKLLEPAPRAEPLAPTGSLPPGKSLARAEPQGHAELLPRAEPLPLAAGRAPEAARPLDAAKGTPAATAERIFARSELPPDVQQSLPKLAISGGVYSDNAAQRMLIVAGQVVNEGAELAPGVVLDQIRARSAVLRFRGWRYSVAY